MEALWASLNRPIRRFKLELPFEGRWKPYGRPSTVQFRNINLICRLEGG